MQDICCKLSRTAAVVVILLAACVGSAWAATGYAGGVPWQVGDIIVCFGTGTCNVLRIVGGQPVLRQTINREEALIAHTRKNAYLVFQEDNLGSLQPGKLADLLVLDRDYLTVPADQIKNIRPVMTMVGGRMVYTSE